MNMEHYPILAIISLFLGAFLVALFGRLNKVLRNLIVAAAVTIPLCLMIALIGPVMLGGQVIGYWMGNWAPVGPWAIGIGLEVDALSLFFGLVVTIAVFVSGLYSFTYMNRDDSLENYYTLFLMLSGSLLGLVLTGDLFNIFVMIEIMTMTAVALTAFRVDYEGALEGALKYMVVGSIGSTSVLVGIAMLYSQLHTLNMAQIAATLPDHQNLVTVGAFAFLFLGFATKAFLFPFHPLAADAHAVAPASISLMISGVITKCGVYGIIRLAYILYQNINEPAVSILITGFGAVSCFICVTMAFNQHDFKRLLAFHSISQVGYVITAVGLGSMLGLSAGLYHAMNHTLFKGLLFLCAGAVQYATGSLDLGKLGGLAKKMPKTCALFLIGAASISGLPPFNGFFSKWMIYQASFEKGVDTGNFFYIVMCVVCLLSSVLTLASFVKVAQSVFFGQLSPQFENTKEVPLAMRIPMWILAVLCILTGVLPWEVLRNLVGPAAAAALNAAGYIQAMLGSGAAAGAGAQAMTLSMEIGFWGPVSWLCLLLMVSCAVCLVAVLGTTEQKSPEERHEADRRAGRTAAFTRDGFADAGRTLKPVEKEGHYRNPVLSGTTLTFTGEKDPKYENFFSGEESEYSQVGGGDLFWGFKTNWRHYFQGMRRWHSGVINDYTRYGIVALAFVLLYACLFL